MKENKHKNRSDSENLLNNKGQKTTHKRSGKAKKYRKRIILFTLEGIILLITLIVFFAFSKLNKLNFEDINSADISTNDVDSDVEKSMKGYTNIALFGVDARDNKSLDKGVRSDAVMICSINNETSEIRLVSVYRDSYLNIEGDSKFDKLCNAYSYGGPKQVMDTLNKNMDLQITQYVTVNWRAVAEAVNILGGVDVDITDAEYKHINGLITETVKSTGIGSVHLKKSGLQRLDGVQAVAYSRIRKIDTDYQRTSRQRLIISLAMEKAKHADLITLNQLVDTVLPLTSSNLSKSKILSLAMDITKYNLVDTAGFPFDKDTKIMGKKGDCVIPLGLEQNVYQLHAFLFGNESYTASSTVIKIDQMIKDASGWGAPGTTVKPTASSTKAATTAAKTEEDITAAESTIAVESTSGVELSTEDLESTIPSESVQTTEEGLDDTTISVATTGEENSKTDIVESIPE